MYFHPTSTTGEFHVRLYSVGFHRLTLLTTVGELLVAVAVMHKIHGMNLVLRNIFISISV